MINLRLQAASSISNIYIWICQDLEMVALLNCCRSFLLPCLSPLSVSEVTLRFHSLVPKIHSCHAINKGVRRMCYMGNSQSSFVRENNSNFCDRHDESSEATKKKDLWLYNTMSRQKEVFRPKVASKVGMYICGITAYDFNHIGHARAYVIFDGLYRYLKYLGHEVYYIRNFTDVDDKIIDDKYAYCVDGDFYFAVERFPDYGRLSGRKLEDNRAGE